MFLYSVRSHVHTPVYLRNISALTAGHAATLRTKLQIKLGVTPGLQNSDTGPANPSTDMVGIVTLWNIPVMLWTYRG